MQIRMCRTLHANLSRGIPRTKSDSEVDKPLATKRTLTTTTTLGTTRSGRTKTALSLSKTTTTKSKPKATTRPRSTGLIKVATVDEDYSPELDMLRRSQERKSRSPLNRNAQKSPLPFSNPNDTYYHELGSPSPPSPYPLRSRSTSPTRLVTTSPHLTYRFSNLLSPSTYRNPNDSTIHEPAGYPPPAPASPPPRLDPVSMSMDDSYLGGRSRVSLSPGRSRFRGGEWGASFARDVSGYRDEGGWMGNGVGLGVGGRRSMSPSRSVQNAWLPGRSTSPTRPLSVGNEWLANGIGGGVTSAPPSGGISHRMNVTIIEQDEKIRRLESVNEELRGEIKALRVRLSVLEENVGEVNVSGVEWRVGELEGKHEPAKQRKVPSLSSAESSEDVPGTVSEEGRGSVEEVAVKSGDVGSGNGSGGGEGVMSHLVPDFGPPPTDMGSGGSTPEGVVGGEVKTEEVGRGGAEGGKGGGRKEEVRFVKNVSLVKVGQEEREAGKEERGKGRGDAGDNIFGRSTRSAGKGDGDDLKDTPPLKQSTRSDSFLHTTTNTRRPLSRSPPHRVITTTKRDPSPRASPQFEASGSKAYIQSLEERLRQTSEFLRSRSRVGGVGVV
ncbi:hypothetical protein HDV00_009422 [Rhizophlyctis rosea]|nr:hypothetical protein HDV00_009422 [Rhizophlyctis rosea]